MSYRTKRRLRLWEQEAAKARACGRGDLPICNLCDLPVRETDAWDESHDPSRPKVFGGTLTAVAHKRCNAEHAARFVTPAAAKAKRVYEIYIGARGPGLGPRPMPGGRRSGVKKKFGGGLVPRTSHSEEHAAFLRRRYGGFTDQEPQS